MVSQAQLTMVWCRHPYYNWRMRSILIVLFVSAVLLVSCDLMQSSKIESAVVKALDADPRTGEFSFEVSHEGAGKVLITGEVDNPAQVDAVKEIAAAVAGVTEVTTRITIVDNSSSGLMQDDVVNTPFF